MTQKPFCQSVHKIILLAFLQSVASYATVGQNNQLFTTSENKRIEATICAESMNRISVTNDRITQIFGDEGTFESQNDEATGQVFFKPTIENGSKNLSLTLITEQGITQDLTLIPSSKSPQTLVLTRDSNNSNTIDNNIELQRSNLNLPVSYQSSVQRNSHESQLNYAIPLPIQDQLLNILKQAIHNQLSIHEGESLTRPLPHLEGISLTSSQSWKSGPYVVDALIVDNTSETPLELQEKDFYQTGDLALSLYAQKSDKSNPVSKMLKAQGQMTLYVVRYGEATQQ